MVNLKRVFFGDYFSSEHLALSDLILSHLNHKTIPPQSFGINVRSVKSSHEITTTGQQEACDECSRIAHTAVMN